MTLTAQAPGVWARGFKRAFNIPGILFILALVIVWEVVVRTGLVELVFFPAPSEVVLSWAQLLMSGQMIQDVGHTLTVAITGWFVGSLVGLGVGLWLGISAISWKYGMATIDFLRSIPAITFVSVAALIFGFSIQMELSVTIYAALWPVLVNTVDGVRRMEPQYLDVAKAMQLSRAAVVVKVMLPAVSGSVIVGLRIALGLALTLAVASEMVGNPAGVGYQLVMQQQALQPASMFAYIIAIGLLGVLLNRLFIVGVRLVKPGIVNSLREDAY